MDLSKVLGDVYDTDETAAAPASAPVSAPASLPNADNVPEWADDAHLDRAFASWTPGPPADAPAAEREMAAGGGPARVRLEEMLAATAPLPADAPAYEAPAAYNAPPAYEAPASYDAPAVYEAPAAVTPPPPPPPVPPAPTYFSPPAPAPAPVAVYGSARQWVRGDDDVVSSGGGKSRGLRRRR